MTFSYSSQELAAHLIDPATLVVVLDLCGTFVFALSGASIRFVALRRKWQLPISRHHA